MTTVVLDANVLASGFLRLNPAATPTQLVDAWRAGRFELIVSEHLRAEVVRAFRTPYFRRQFSPARAGRARALLRYEATQTRLTVEVHGVATHAEDDLILATAASAKAEYLVTGDEKLRGLGIHEGVQIVSPRAFLEILQRQQKEE